MCPDSPIWDFRAVPRSDAGEVVGFALGPSSTSPRVSRWGGGRICPRGIFGQSQRQTLGGQIYGFRSFDQSQGQSLGRCPDSPIWDFRAVPRSDAGIPSFCLKGILRAVLGPDAWRWSDSPIRDFRPSLGSDAWQVVSFPDSGLFTSPLVSRWGYAFSGIRSLHKVIR